MNAMHHPQLGTLVLLLGIALPWQATKAGDDRIFADGFDPCCQVGGTVSGLTGSGLVLRLTTVPVTEDKPIAVNGPYQFAASLPPGTNYAVSVLAQPAGETCSVSNANGAMGSVPITNIDVQCNTPDGLIWDSGQWDAKNWQ